MSKLRRTNVIDTYALITHRINIFTAVSINFVQTHFFE
jgi:hypothetical protein